MNKLLEMKNDLIFVLVLLMVWCPATLSQNQQDAYNTAEAFAIALSKNWGDMNELKRWGDPAFNAELEKNPSVLKLDKVIGEKVGAFKSITSIDLVRSNATRADYTVAINYASGPAKLTVNLDLVGKTWKVQAYNINSQVLKSVFAVDDQTLARLQQYVNYVVPKLGRRWDFNEFKAESDPRLMHGMNDAAAKQTFAKSTNPVGPITRYRKSEIIDAGRTVENNPQASYYAYFTTKKGEFRTRISVCYENHKYKITCFYLERKN